MDETFWTRMLVRAGALFVLLLLVLPIVVLVGLCFSLAFISFLLAQLFSISARSAIRLAVAGGLLRTGFVWPARSRWLG